MPTPRALVFLAQGAEEMEVTIVVDVLRRAGVEVVLAGIDGPGPVRCSRGVVLVPDAALAACAGEDFDAIVLPGGAEGARRLAESATVGTLARAQVAAGRVLAAICAAPGGFAALGVGAGASVTCHPSVRAAVAAHGRHVDARVVQDGVIVTSQGPGTAFEFALAVAARLVPVAAVLALAGPMLLAAGSTLPE